MLSGEERIFLPKLTVSLNKMRRGRTSRLWSPHSLFQAVGPSPVPPPGRAPAARPPLAGAPGPAVLTGRARVPLLWLHLPWCWNMNSEASHRVYYPKPSVSATQLVSLLKNFTCKSLSLRKLILNKQELMFSHTYFCDHLVQTVFQFDGHIPTFYWGYKGHLQHLEHLQIWLAVKDTLNIMYQAKIFEKYSLHVKWKTQETSSSY